MSDVSRKEFGLLCEVVELILAVPGGVADMQRVLSWQGQDVLNRFAEMRSSAELIKEEP